MHMESWAGSEQGIKLCQDKQKIPWSVGQDTPTTFSMEWGPSPSAFALISPPHKGAEPREGDGRKEPEKQQKLKTQLHP